MDSFNSLKNFSFVGIGRIVTIALTALFYLLFAKLLQPEIYGELSLILAIAGTFSTVSILGLNLSIQVYRAKNESQISDQIITLFLILTSVAAVILIAFDPIAAVLCVGMSFFLMNQGYLFGLKEYKKSMLYSVVKSVTFFVIPILLYFVLEIPGIVLGMAISNFLGGIPMYRSLKIKSLHGMKHHYKIIFHNFGLTLGVHLPSVVDKLIIAPLFGFFIVGVYQFNFQVFIALGVLPGILYGYLVSEESSGIGHRKLSNLAIITSIILVIIVFFLAPILVPIFYPKYLDGVESLQIITIAIIPQTVGAIYGSKLLARESTKIGYSAIVQIGSLLLLIALLGNLYGLIGLALAVLISQTANTLFLYYLYRKSILPKIK
jgi:O-antigen/teichoic acid export membrane protein